MSGKLSYSTNKNVQGKKKSNQRNALPPVVDDTWKRNESASVKSMMGPTPGTGVLSVKQQQRLALMQMLSDQQIEMSEGRGEKELDEEAATTDESAQTNKVPDLAAICLEVVFRCFTLHLKELEQLPYPLRNQILSNALLQGQLSVKQMKLLIHPEMDRLDFSNEKYQQTINDYFFERFVPHVPEIPEFDDWEEVTPSELYIAPRGCPGLNTLSIAGCSNLSLAYIEVTIPKFEYLRELDLSGLDNYTINGITLSSGSLQHLRIDRLKHSGPKYPSFKCTLMTPNLTSLSLRGTISDTLPLFKGTPPSQLDTLDLSDGYYYDTLSPQMSALLSLIHFLAGPIGNTVTTLHLAGCNLNSVGLQKITEIEGLRLREVNLSNNKALSTGSVIGLLDSPVCGESLLRLDVSHCFVNVSLLYDCWMQMLVDRKEKKDLLYAELKTWD